MMASMTFLGSFFPQVYANPILDTEKEVVLKTELAQLTAVFKQGEKGYHTFRIPAIVKTKNGALLAFAEGRVNGSGDHGNIDIVMKRSSDGGKTWGDFMVITDDGKNQCGNPAPVVDQKSGAIILVSCGSNSSEGAVMDGKATREIYVQTSKDSGRTWSPRQNISEQVRQPNWRWYATGPCNGIQIKEGKYAGRLVIPCNHSNELKEYHAHSIYSDDMGKTWKIGDIAATGSNESSVAEVKRDLLVQSMRMQNNSKGKRGIRTSTDGGATWSELTHDPSLNCPRCQGSVLRDYRKPEILYFSNPTGGGRKGMEVRMSVDGGRTWDYGKLVYAGPSAYSNLVITKTGDVGVLFEAGVKDIAESIVFTKYKPREIMVIRPKK